MWTKCRPRDWHIYITVNLTNWHAINWHHLGRVGWPLTKELAVLFLSFNVAARVFWLESFGSGFKLHIEPSFLPWESDPIVLLVQLSSFGTFFLQKIPSHNLSSMHLLVNWSCWTTIHFHNIYLFYKLIIWKSYLTFLWNNLLVPLFRVFWQLKWQHFMTYDAMT